MPSAIHVHDPLAEVRSPKAKRLIAKGKLDPSDCRASIHLTPAVPGEFLSEEAKRLIALGLINPNSARASIGAAIAEHGSR